jgi:hypothetical protein
VTRASHTSSADVWENVFVSNTPEHLYDMVSDIARMGEWSPSCIGGFWDTGCSESPGDWFTGINRSDDHETYETRNQVLVADRPREFSWVAGGLEEGWAVWAYRFRAARDGTEVAESWTLIRQYESIEDDSIEQLRNRTRNSIAATLKRLRNMAER